MILGSSGLEIPSNGIYKKKTGLKDDRILFYLFSLLAKQKRTVSCQVKSNTNKLLKISFFHMEKPKENNKCISLV